ncbi:MAG: DUF4374 domain-containing protein [Rikenellaceae bacterium]
MKRNYFLRSLFFAAAVAVAATSCSTDDEDGVDVGTDSDGSGSDSTPELVASSYVVAVTTTDGADYLLYTDELGSSDLSVLGAGVETDLASAQWYFYKDQRIFGLLYSDGDPAPMETYVMGETRPVFGMEYTSYRFTTYGTWGDYMVTSSSNSYTAESTGVYEPYFNTEVYPRHMYVGKYHYSNGLFAGEDFVSDNYLGTGEYCSMSGFAESNGWLYATVYPMGATAYGTTKYASSFQSESASYYGDSATYLDYVSIGWGGMGSGSFKPGEIATTPFPDQFHIAIFKDEADFPQNPTVLIKDDRMSPACGRQQSSQYDTIVTDQDEDVYIFSPGNERSYAGAGTQLYSDESKTVAIDEADGGILYKATGTHKGSVMRIKKGETSLDESYGVFDVETAMGGRSFITCWYITGSTSKFLVKTMNDAGVQYSTANNKFYVVDVINQTAIEVSNMPEPTTITSTSRNPYFEDGKAYMGIVSSENASPVIYEIDSATGAAKNIMSVECASIASIGKLSKYE